MSKLRLKDLSGNFHQTRGELEADFYGRQCMEDSFTRSHISFPYLLFIDDFGVHRNMYRALKAF